MNALAFLVISFVVAADNPSKDSKSLDDIAKLQGTWEFTSQELDGKAMPPPVFHGSKIEIAGARFTTTTGTIVYKGTFKVDAAQSPKTIDLTFTEGPEKGKTSLGIYELDGDNWKICLEMNGRGRPKEFATKPGSGLALETLKRKKAAADSAAIKTEMARFEGEWSMVSGESNGQEVPEMFRTQFKRVAKGDETTVTIGDRVFMKARFTIDPSHKPKTIDYDVLEGATKGKKQLGIYEFEGETIKFCFASPGGARPADFTAPADSGRTSSVWKRASK